MSAVLFGWLKEFGSNVIFTESKFLLCVFFFLKKNCNLNCNLTRQCVGQFSFEIQRPTILQKCINLHMTAGQNHACRQSNTFAPVLLSLRYATSLSLRRADAAMKICRKPQLVGRGEAVGGRYFRGSQLFPCNRVLTNPRPQIGLLIAGC